MEILTEFDELQAALAKINIDESVFTYQNGKLIDSEAFNKSQKILNCPEMISAHKYIYELDMDQLTEEDTDKINQLYDLGVKRGFIIDDLTHWNDDTDDEEEEITAVEEVPTAPAQPQNTLFKAKVPCWTVIYSATKDGSIKTGEAYSNAVSMTAAKADVNAKLSQCGYDNITILAIENCVDAPKQEPSIETAVEVTEADDEEKKEDTETANDDTSDDISDEDESDDETSDDDTTDDESDESDEDESDDETSDDDTSDEDDKDESDDDTSDEDESDESDDEDEEELDAGKKSELRNMYRQTFKNTLVKCKFDTSFNDLTLEQKVKFFTELSKAWTKDYDPKEFMTDKELEQLDNVVVDVDDGNDEDTSDDSEEDNTADED